MSSLHAPTSQHATASGTRQGWKSDSMLARVHGSVSTCVRHPSTLLIAPTMRESKCPGSVIAHPRGERSRVALSRSRSLAGVGSRTRRTGLR